MLVLTLEGDNGIIIRTSDGDIRVVLAKPTGDAQSSHVKRARICFDAPDSVSIWRDDVLAKPDFRGEGRAEQIARLQRLLRRMGKRS